jgi:phage baseplate assembly protein gpV
MPRIGNAGIAVLLVGGICGAFLMGALSKTDATPSLAVGRYQVVSNGGSLFRMDTATGEIAVCTPSRDRNAVVTCGFTPSETSPAR